MSVKMYRNFDHYHVFTVAYEFDLKTILTDNINPDKVDAILNDPYSFLNTRSISRVEGDLLTLVTNHDPVMMNHLAKCIGAYLENVVNPTDEIIAIACERFPNAMSYLKKKPSDELIRLAFLRKPDSFRTYGKTGDQDKTSWISPAIFAEAVEAGLFDSPNNQYAHERSNASTILADMKLTPEQQVMVIDRNPNNAWYFMQGDKSLSSLAQDALALVYGKTGKFCHKDIRDNLIKWNTNLRKAILSRSPWDMRKYMDKLTTEEIEFAKQQLIDYHKGHTFEEMRACYKDGGTYISVPLFALSESEQIRAIETTGRQIAQYSYMFLPEFLQVYCVLNGKKKPTKASKGWWKRY